MNADHLLTGLGRISGQAGVLVLLVLLVQWVFSKQLTPRWRCALWFVVIARLMLPFSPESAASIFNLAPRWESRRAVPAPVEVARVAAAEITPALAEKTSVAQREPEPRRAPDNSVKLISTGAEATPRTLPTLASAAPTPAPTATGFAFSWRRALLWGWMAGVLALGSYCVVCSWRMIGACRRLPALTNATLLALRDDCARRLAVPVPPVLVESAAISTPALFGLWRPRLLLPAGFLERFTEQELRYVLLHEMAHLRRRDLWLNWLTTLLQIVHWFNPLVWLAFARWRADRELASDALALEAAGDGQNGEYGRTILHLLESFTHRTAAPGLVGILEDRRQLQRRIGMIANFRPGQRWGALAVGLMVLLAVVGLTDAQTRKTGQAAAENSAETREERVGIDPVSALPWPDAEWRHLVVTVLDDQGKPLPRAEVEMPYDRRGGKMTPRRLTDASGQFALRIPMPPAKSRREMNNFTINAEHSDFASRSMMWTSSAGDVLAGMPDGVTLRLDRGVSVGGTVRDEHDRPIQGARLLFSGRGNRVFPTGNAASGSQEYTDLQKSDLKSPAATSDALGHWTFRHFPADLKNVTVTVVRPDDARESFSTHDDNLNRYSLISIADLKAQALTTSLRAGHIVRGIVVDEKGRPLHGVTVKEGYGHANIVRASEFVTDRQGRFERPHRLPRQWIYTASAEGRATASVVAQVEENMPEVRIVLPPAKPWRVRVMDEAGQPLSDAELNVDTYGTDGQIIDWSAQVNGEGRAVWTNAPATNVTLAVRSTALGVYQKIKYKPGEPERTVVLSSRHAERVTIRVKATDAVTRQPVKVQSVARFESGGFSSQPLVTPDASEFAIEIRKKDFTAGSYPSYELKLEAAGYETVLLESLDFFLGDQSIEPLFHRVDGLNKITLLRPDGTPAAGVRLWTRASPHQGTLYLHSSGHFQGDQMTKAEADDQGQLPLPGVPPDPPVIIADTTGFLTTNMSALRTQNVARLAPYGAIEGRLLVAGQPKGGQNINLNSLNSLTWSSSLALYVAYTARTDAEGRFAFNQVPAGEYKLYRWALPKKRDTSGQTITETYQVPVIVVAGQTNVVEYASSGRAIIGQAVSAPADLTVDWFNDVHTLSLKLPSVKQSGRANREDYASFAAFLKVHNASRESEARRRDTQAARTYALEFEADGSFRIDDVPPGSYELRLRVTRTNSARHRPSLDPRDELGSLIREIVVPEGREPLDLGTLAITMKETAEPKSGPAIGSTPSISFQGRTLDGVPLSLAQFKGTNVLLVVWAAWSDRSMEQWLTLEKLQAEFAREPRLAFVSISLDESADVARRALPASGATGLHGWLDEEARVKLTTALDVTTLPAICLIDANGHLIARDLEGDRLPMTLRRTVAKR